MNLTVREMPRYQCHKKVWALKIKEINRHTNPNPEPMVSTSDDAYGATIIPAEAGYGPFFVEAEYLRKHRPTVGGYYVMYEDGYVSYSPAPAFESGYTLITGGEIAAD